MASSRTFGPVAVGLGALAIAAVPQTALAQYVPGPGGSVGGAGVQGMQPGAGPGGAVPGDLPQERGLHGDASLGVRFDPQAARGDNTVAAAQGLQQDELIYSLVGAVRYANRLAGFQTSLEASYDDQIHQKNESLDTRSYALTPRLARRFGPCGLETSGTVRRRQSLLEQSDLSYFRNKEDSLLAAGAVGCVSGGFLGGAQATYSQQDNSAPRSRDSESTTGGAYVGYGNAALGTFSLMVAYADVDANSRLALVTPTGLPSIRSWNYSLVYNRSVLRNLYGSVSVGYVTNEANDGSGVENDGVSATASLTYLIGERLRIDVGYSHGVTAGDLAGAAFNLRQPVGSSVTVGQNGSAATLGTNDNYRAEITYRLGQRISFGLAYSRTTTLSELIGASYNQAEAAALRAGYSSERFSLDATVTYEDNSFDGQILLPSGMLSELQSVAKTQRLSYRIEGAYRFGERFDFRLAYVEDHSENRSLVRLDLSPISQLQDDVTRRVTASAGVQLPFDTRLALEASYERRNASVANFDFDAFRGGATLSVAF